MWQWVGLFKLSAGLSGIGQDCLTGAGRIGQNPIRTGGTVPCALLIFLVLLYNPVTGSIWLLAEMQMQMPSSVTIASVYHLNTSIWQRSLAIKVPQNPLNTNTRIVLLTWCHSSTFTPYSARILLLWRSTCRHTLCKDSFDPLCLHHKLAPSLWRTRIEYWGCQLFTEDWIRSPRNSLLPALEKLHGARVFTKRDLSRVYNLACIQDGDE